MNTELVFDADISGLIALPFLLSAILIIVLYGVARKDWVPVTLTIVLLVTFGATMGVLGTINHSNRISTVQSWVSSNYGAVVTDEQAEMLLRNETVMVEGNGVEVPVRLRFTK